MTTYNEADEALHRSWVDMNKRCHGARPDPRCEGQSVHPEWRQSYRPFRDWVNANLGPRPEGFYLKRIDHKSDFAPGNLHWASRSGNPTRDTTDEPPIASASATADGRFRARLSMGTYATEGEALTVAEEVLAFMRDNYSP